MSLSILIKNATVVDGSGGAAFMADIAVQNDRISDIGILGNAAADKIIDAKGKVLCPGFVDIHSHSDYYLLVNPQAESKIRQGVTTEVGGNCGYSAAPIGGKVLKERQRQYKENYSLDLDWQTMAEYGKRINDAKVSVNFVPLIGHNTVRSTVMGMENRPPTPEELAQMEKLVEQAMQEGAFGISSGLVYPPACFSRPQELTALCKIAARYGGILTCHIRSEGPQLLESLREIIEIAQGAQIPLQISHLKTAGPPNWYKLEEAINIIETAQNNGVEVTADRYPYLASNAGLAALLPDWAFEGGIEKQLQRLGDKATRDKMAAEILKNHPEEEYWDKVVISQVVSAENDRWTGLTVAEAADLKHKSPLNFVFDLLLEEKMQVEAIYFIMSAKNLQKILALPYMMIGSDAANRAHYGPLGEGSPHPRAFGTFPKILSEFVRKKKIFTQEEAIYKMTSFPCQKLGLKDRGLIKAGYAADIVIFDSQKITDTATYQNPIQYPVGIDYVIVNGKIAVKEGGHIEEGNGIVLKK